MLDNIKRLTSEMDVKADFVRAVATSYGMSYNSVKREWFQAEWKIPENEQPNIVKMAQIYLFKETHRKAKLLQETGYNKKIEE